MNRVNVEFFETYKKIDRLCAQMYGLSGGGVTAYIDDMKAHAYGTRRPDNWNVTFNTLRRLRHMRNEMAHDEGGFDTAMCTYEDIYWLNSFYDALMHGRDPLSCIYHRQVKMPANNTYDALMHGRDPLSCIYHRQAKMPANNTYYAAPSNYNKSHRGSGKIMATVIILLLIFLIALAFYVYKTCF